MTVLLVVAHPLEASFTQCAARRIRESLERRGTKVDLIDLYADHFDPCLSAAERQSYFTQAYDGSAVIDYVVRVKQAEKLILVFPQWWFNVPAILKGFLDRVLVPGVAFDQLPGGPLVPRLTKVDALYVVTSTGAPWWITKLYMGDPVRRQFARGVKPFVSRKARFRMLTLHDMDRMTESRAEAFLRRLDEVFARI